MGNERREPELLQLLAPLAGWVLPLAEVPDPVFAGALAGDGVAIDPTGETLHAPCDGSVLLMANNRHALTLRSRAGDVLIHVGIDTVQLAGEGFELCVGHGEQVVAGQTLLRFDLDLIARRAPSAITPVLLAGMQPGRIARRHDAGRIAVGDFLMAAPIVPASASTHSSTGAARAATGNAAASVRRFRVPFDHGLHARPAAQVAAALAGLQVEVRLQAHGKEANAHSTIALMALGVRRGETVTAIVDGRDTHAALGALAGLLDATSDQAPLSAPAPPREISSSTAAEFATRTATPAPAPGTRLAAVCAARGLAIGPAAPLHSEAINPGAAQGDAAHERRRLDVAIDTVSAALERLSAGADSGAGTVADAGAARREVLAAHMSLLADPELRREARGRIDAGASAGTAWRDVLRIAAEALAALADPRMAERRADLRDIEQQVQRVLAGHAPSATTALPAHAIVIAGEMLPSQLLALDPTQIAGLCMARGGATSHVAIMAASLGLPMLVAVGEPLLAIAVGTPLILDADAGQLIVDPSASELSRTSAHLAARGLEQARDLEAALRPATTLDGSTIQIYCNLGAVAEAAPAVNAGAEGCGLLRTEFLFLEREQAPDEAEQLAQYQAIAQALGGRPLSIRTLDAGGDKPIAYLPQPHEDNPALGLRGLRTSLSRPELLLTQLRAIMRVAPHGQCRILLPMVNEPGELRQVRAHLAALSQELQLPVPALGIMIETPAAALLADQLCAQIDFLSIGSNDLTQYTLAMDRLHPQLASRLDGLHPAVLQLMARAARAGRARNIEVGVCGGLAADPEAVPLLIGLGVQELSMVSARIPRIKSLVRTLDARECAVLAERALAMGEAVQVRTLMREWGSSRG